MNDLKKIIDRNYDSIVKRGLINNNTNNYDFLSKLLEETQEVLDALKNEDIENLKEEVADVILVCLNFYKHNNFDAIKELNKKIDINFKRSEL